MTVVPTLGALTVLVPLLMAGTDPAHAQMPDHHAEHQVHGSQSQPHHRNPHGMQHSFADVERWSSRFDAPDRAAWQKPEHVVALLDVRPGMTVADLGAGTGYFLAALAAAAGPEGSVLALDVEPEMIAFMKGRAHQAPWPNVSARLIPTDDPGLEQASVDRILIVNTWHHIGARADYSRRLREALRPHGAVVIVDYTMDSPDGPPVEHRLPAQQIVEELQAGGLSAHTLSEQKEDLPYQFVVVATLP